MALAHVLKGVFCLWGFFFLMALGSYAVGNCSINANIKMRQHRTVYAFLMLLLERSLAAKTQSFQALWVLYPQFL